MKPVLNTWNVWKKYGVGDTCSKLSHKYKFCFCAVLAHFALIVPTKIMVLIGVKINTEGRKYF